MRRIAGCLMAGVLALIMTAEVIPQGMAAESMVMFQRGEEWFSFTPGSGYTDSDLFPEFKDVMPGDRLEQTITVVNRNRDEDAVRFYLRAVPHDDDNPLTYHEGFENQDGKDQQGVSGRRDETAASMEDFLSKLTLRVYSGGRCISVSTAETGGPLENAYLCSAGPGETVKLRVELEVPVELDNRYANRVGEVDWIFTAEVYKDPGAADVPKTADGIGPAWCSMIVSGGTLAAAWTLKRKKGVR